MRNIDGGAVVLAIASTEVLDGAVHGRHARLVPRRGVRRLLGGAAERIPVASWGRTVASDREREAVVDLLKRAYIADRISTEDLADLSAGAHDASTLEELERIVREVER